MVSWVGVFVWCCHTCRLLSVHRAASVWCRDHTLCEEAGEGRGRGLLRCGSCYCVGVCVCVCEHWCVCVCEHWCVCVRV